MKPTICCILWFMEKEWKQLFCIHSIWEEIIKSIICCLAFNCLLWYLVCQISRLREYQGVDPHFDVIARQYHEIVKVIWLSFVAMNYHMVDGLLLTCWAAETGGHAVDNSPGGNGSETSPWSRGCLKTIFLVDHVWYMNAVDVIMLVDAIMWFDLTMCCFVAPDQSGWIGLCKVSSEHAMYTENISVCVMHLVILSSRI
jgi:hypothetical protein